MITGIEVYKTKAEIPKEFARYTWGKEDCWLVAYWTYDFRNKPIRKSRCRKPHALAMMDRTKSGWSKWTWWPALGT